ncbi:hypothetical protein OGATHE_002834 [Ogataea polymorpha]|uniref:Uncharacterized protein n=1 Tax=Ogataea polymorpha TaxID=460523 RepID=A0A9P8T8N1_9ASCO|nr:hypothetical protein OGATHE_002834 [Ogataea polymorpha]
MGNQSSSNKFTNQRGQIRRNSLHSRRQVVRQLFSVSSKLNNLLCQGLDVAQIVLSDLGSHRNLCSSLDLGLNLLGQDLAEVGAGSIRSYTHCQNNSGKGHGINNNLGQFWKMPSVPFFTPHGIGIKLFVQVIKQSNGLHNHHIHLVGTELELVSANGVSQTKRHG